MMTFDSICLVINPRAGKGFLESAAAAREIVKAFQPARVFTGPGELGEYALHGLDSIEVIVLQTSREPGRDQTQGLTRQFVNESSSAIIAVGGDGTLADVACVLIEQKSEIPLFGVGVGSTNAGSLISCRISDLAQFCIEDLQIRKIKALVAYDSNGLLGIGFNDCVLGFTIVGTRNGKICDLDASERMAGKFCAGQPRSIASAKTLVIRSGPDGNQEIAQGKNVATVVIGFAEQNFFAKAITGGVCLASLVQAPAGCLTSNVPLVRIGIDRQELMAMPPISCSFIPFDGSHRIIVSDVKKDTVLSVDGNPLKRLEPSDVVEFGIITDAVNSLQMSKA
jgi:hypothetical protein